MRGVQPGRQGLRHGRPERQGPALGRGHATPHRPPMKHQDWVSSVAFSPDGKTILSGGHDGEARLWDAASGRRIPVPPLIHSGRQVFSVAFSPDGKTILTGGQDCMARLWDVATMRPIGPPIVHDDYIGEPDDWVRAVA